MGLENENMKLSQEVESTTATITTLQRRYQEGEQDVRKLENENMKLSQEFESTTATITTLQRRCQEGEQERDALRSRFEGELEQAECQRKALEEKSARELQELKDDQVTLPKQLEAAKSQR